MYYVGASVDPMCKIILDQKWESKDVHRHTHKTFSSTKCHIYQVCEAGSLKRHSEMYYQTDNQLFTELTTPLSEN